MCVCVCVCVLELLHRHIWYVRDLCHFGNHVPLSRLLAQALNPEIASIQRRWSSCNSKHVFSATLDGSPALLPESSQKLALREQLALAAPD